MKRLTKYGKTTHENGVCCTHFNSAECAELQGNCSYGCQWEEKVWEKLARYEDLEEQGRLIELPCAVGDTVYYPEKEFNFVYPVKISEIILSDLGNGEQCFQFNGCFFDGNGDPNIEFDFDNEDFGNIVFLTKEEAEAALKESEKE